VLEARSVFRRDFSGVDILANALMRRIVSSISARISGVGASAGFLSQ